MVDAGGERRRRHPIHSRTVTTQQKATLKPYLNEIRDWVARGMTDVWIAHTLNSTPASISAFRSANGILRRDAGEARGGDVPPPVMPPDATEVAVETKPKRRRSSRAKKPTETAETQVEVAAGSSEEGAASRRRRRGGRGRGRKPTQHAFEAVLDHGDEGYGFWLDGAVKDDPVFAEHWGDRRALVVRIEADQIVIRPDDRANGAG
jgi:hypothetical protein